MGRVKHAWATRSTTGKKRIYSPCRTGHGVVIGHTAEPHICCMSQTGNFSVAQDCTVNSSNKDSRSPGYSLPSLRHHRVVTRLTESILLDGQLPEHAPAFSCASKSMNHSGEKRCRTTSLHVTHPGSNQKQLCCAHIVAYSDRTCIEFPFVRRIKIC